MKKLLSLLILMAFVFAVKAQSTTPRWGSGAGNDNTGRVLTWKYTTLTDAAGADSIAIYPAAYQTIYRIALTDSFYFKSPTVTKSYAGDKITIVASGSSGAKAKFAGTNFITAGTATLSSSGRAVINLVFDGAKWVEASRVVQ